ncbi:hypothetical protein [Blastococcus sp. PRF04-17]|uniref:hypothetical protein n=1 Tax=Blastococcus sp. PRF04-17 TaxID=2933797 RepID=UPI001FF485B1|nr:hypothetical protein [Blastococcus sp. PRF04-17]UOY04099.1 hypothetical protein MVA48_12430 [Blastococcus sp. PRF04-17]
MLVVQILLAFAMFSGLLFLVDRWASRCTVEDSIAVAEQRKARRAARRAARAVRAPLPADPDLFVAKRPIQVVAADLRRLSRQLALVPSGSTLVRWKALWVAYDVVLAEAAQMLEVQSHLAEQPPAGVARDVERVRLLAALESAGLVVRG